MNKLPGTEIGYISACIGGDHRYTSRLSVRLDGDKVHVILTETNPIGGMDGPGGTMPFRETGRTTVQAVPKLIVKAIKSTMDDTIRRYGKPTKNFEWVGHEGVGLSADLVSLALAAISD